MVGGACLAGVIDALGHQSLVTVGGAKAAMSAVEWFAIDMDQGMRAGGRDKSRDGKRHRKLWRCYDRVRELSCEL